MAGLTIVASPLDPTASVGTVARIAAQVVNETPAAATGVVLRIRSQDFYGDAIALGDIAPGGFSEQHTLSAVLQPNPIVSAMLEATSTNGLTGQRQIGFASGGTPVNPPQPVFPPPEVTPPPPPLPPGSGFQPTPTPTGLPLPLLLGVGAAIVAVALLMTQRPAMK